MGGVGGFGKNEGGGGEVRIEGKGAGKEREEKETSSICRFLGGGSNLANGRSRSTSSSIEMERGGRGGVTVVRAMWDT